MCHLPRGLPNNVYHVALGIHLRVLKSDANALVSHVVGMASCQAVVAWILVALVEHLHL